MPFIYSGHTHKSIGTLTATTADFISCLSEKEAEYFDLKKIMSAPNFSEPADKTEAAAKKKH